MDVGWGASELLVELCGVLVALVQDLDFRLPLPLTVQSSAESCTFVSLVLPRVGSVPLSQGETLVQDEDIAGVQAGTLHRDFGDTNILASLDPEEAGGVGFRFDMVETTLHTALQDPDSTEFLEVVQEELALVTLDFPVLDGKIPEEGVQLHSLVSRRPSLVCGRLRPEPEVDIVEKTVGILLLVGVEEDVAVPGEELLQRLETRLDLELFDPPFQKSRFAPSTLPGRLAFRSSFFAFALDIGTELLDVRLERGEQKCKQSW